MLKFRTCTATRVVKKVKENFMKARELTIFKTYRVDCSTDLEEKLVSESG